MAWKNDRYYYSKGFLRAIASSYHSIYESGLATRYRTITNPWLIAEHKADFDLALEHLGHSKSKALKLVLTSSRFQDYNRYSRLQQIVIADIIGYADVDLMKRGFYDIPRLRAYAYSLMVRFLNEGILAQR